MTNNCYVLAYNFKAIAHFYELGFKLSLSQKRSELPWEDECGLTATTKTDVVFVDCGMSRSQFHRYLKDNNLRLGDD